MAKPHLVFDLGNVLIRWDPVPAFAAHFDGVDQTRDWLDRIGFDAWNRLQDGGRPLDQGLAAARAAHGNLAAPLEGYADAFPITIQQPVPGSWDLAEALKSDGHRLFAITNWSADNWPAATATYPRLTTLFEDIVVSGIERMLKPEPEIYLTLTLRNGIAPGDCIFIDDSAANVAGAQAVGMDAILFTDTPSLARDLRQRGIALAGDA